METKKTKLGGGVSLSEDIVFDVLSRLPAKPLCRFRCASKGWRALIADPAFVAAHKSRAAPLVAGAFAASRQYELRVMDTDGNVLRVVKDVKRMTLVPTRLDLVFINAGAQLGAMVIDPATGRVVTVGESVDDDPSLGTKGIYYFYRLGRALSGAYKVLCRRSNMSPGHHHGGAEPEPT